MTQDEPDREPTAEEIQAILEKLLPLAESSDPFVNLTLGAETLIGV